MNNATDTGEPAWSRRLEPETLDDLCLAIDVREASWWPESVLAAQRQHAAEAVASWDGGSL